MALVQQADGGGGKVGTKKVFIPRLEPPNYSDPNYINTAYNGKNPCIVPENPVVRGSVLPNCVGYAWGRFMEILGKTPSLSCGNAGTWWYATQDGYDRGSKAQLGAVICWSQPGKAGHVAIVEQINSDGSIVISQSGYNYKAFWTQTVPADYSISGYVFQGFIYNPACKSTTTLYTQFMKTVMDTVGKSGDDVRAKYNLSNNENWNVLFIPYCLEAVGLNDIVPKEKSATDFVKLAINNYGAKWHRHYQFGSLNYTPKPGDIVCIVFDEKKANVTDYYTDRVAIIARNSKIIGNQYTVYAVEGDVNNKVKQVIYSNSTSYIKGYLEIDWSRANVSRYGTSYVPSEIYDELNDSDDAIMREISYLYKDKPQLTKSDIRLSVINYTTDLAAIFRYFGKSDGSPADYLISDTEYTGDIQFNDPMIYNGYNVNTGSIIFNEFMRQGVKASAAIGIMSYMWFESGGWNPAAINLWENQPWEYRGRGLAQWSLGRAVAFVKAVPNWETNITGQVRYCVNEMQSSYRGLYDYIMTMPNTAVGAEKAAIAVSFGYGAGLPYDSKPSAYPAFYGGEQGLRVHTDPAPYMWEHNITVKGNAMSSPIIYRENK